VVAAEDVALQDAADQVQLKAMSARPRALVVGDGSRETTPRLATRTAAATARMIRNVRVTRLACAIWIQASSLAASGFGRTRGAAFRLLEEFLRHLRQLSDIEAPQAAGRPRRDSRV